MTHGNIYAKFLIEYDKLNTTATYPSLTQYEVATLLNKAYLALISQKVSGNNQRNAGFEYDNKAISDIRQLECRVTLAEFNTDDKKLISNDHIYAIPQDYLFYVDSDLHFEKNNSVVSVSDTQLINHQLAKQFKCTDTNMPWIETPVVYIEDEYIHVLVDPYYFDDVILQELVLTYIQKPALFDTYALESSTKEFELSDSMAEELINLAIVFATEITESPRLETKLKTTQLES